MGGGVNAGKFLVTGLGLSAVLAGGAMYYLQVYAYYDEVPVENAEVALTRFDGEVEAVSFANYQGIDSNSSPIRYRACFELDLSIAALTETYAPYDLAEPLVAPGWFDCFDARTIGEALIAGEAFAFMGVENITYGIDRVVAVFPDGRAYSWHQINPCGEVVFDGERPPASCPPVPERLQ